jgi:hypothetical protein
VSAAPAARLAFDDATRTVTVQYAVGVDLDAIGAHHDDVSASLLTNAQAGYGRAYAAEYADTARTLVASSGPTSSAVYPVSKAHTSGAGAPAGARDEPHPPASALTCRS